MKNSVKKNANQPGEITLLLSEAQNPDALRTVIQMVYDELHDVARSHVRGQPRGRTLQATALLNEACLRLLRSNTVMKNRRYFFGAASNAMRRILVESARRRNALKRGGDWTRINLDTAESIGFERPDEVLDFDAALGRLRDEKPALAELAALIVFGQHSTTEVAAILEMAPSTARRKWAEARLWLQRALRASNHSRTYRSRSRKFCKP